MPMALDLAETRDVLARLLDLLRAGTFPHAADKDDCRYCDYEAVCGGPLAAASRAKEKLAKSTLPVLQAFREIHGEVDPGTRRCPTPRRAERSERISAFRSCRGSRGHGQDDEPRRANDPAHSQG